MEEDSIRTGDKTSVTFEFKYKAEFIEKDDILIFREGKTKGIGRVTEII